MSEEANRRKPASKTELRRGRIQPHAKPDARALITEAEQDFLFTAGVDSPPSPLVQEQ
jgi:hypothetical protein